jgi:hypothetical protein
VGEGAAVAARPGYEPDGPGGLDPLLGGEGEAVQAGLSSKPVEFDGFKAGVVEGLPDTEELDRIPVAQPVANEVVGVVGVAVPGDIGEGDVCGSRASLII